MKAFKMESSKFDIIILGAGAQATAFLSAIYHITKNIKKMPNLTIGIVDKQENYGCGVIYNEDYPWIIMNTPITDLSVELNNNLDFSDWLQENIELYCTVKTNNYVSRSVFGKYLNYKFNFYKNCLLKNGVLVETINGLAVNIEDNPINKDVIVTLHDKRSLLTKNLVIAIGKENSEDIYDLKKHSNYIHSPFPAFKKIAHFPKKSCVGIIGSNLTAIDVAVTLKHLNHQGKIIMSSRGGLLPEVKGKHLRAYPPKYALHKNYLKIFNNKKNGLTLLDILRPIRKELKNYNLNWRNIFFPKTLSPDNTQKFEQRVYEAINFPTNFNIILGMIPEIAKTWNLVKNSEIDLFIKKYHRFIHQKHGAIPLVNAKKILDLLKTEQLNLKGDILDIRYENNKFKIEYKNNDKTECDYIVNAMGTKKSACNNIFLTSPFKSLCQYNLINEVSGGGIITDFLTGKIQSKNNKYSPRIRAIAHNAEGSHPFINNFAWILESSHHVAEDLINEVLNAHKKY